MKKYILYTGIVAASLTSCSDEEVVDVASGDVITFRTSMALNEVSRGAEITTNNMQQFKVTALEQVNGYNSVLFDTALFKRGDNSEFTTDKEYLWYEGANLTFYAYSFLTQNGQEMNDALMGIPNLGPDDRGGCEVTLTHDQRTINNVVPAKEIKDHLDIVVAQENATYEDNRKEAVTLTFRHIMSQLVVKAKTDNEAYDFYVKGVKFCNLSSKGDWNWDQNDGLVHEKGGGWSIRDNSKANYEVRYTDNPIKLSSDIKDITNVGGAGYPMVIPQTVNSTNTSYTYGWGHHVAVLLQIRTKETDLQVFPVGYEGAYAWACIPLYVGNYAWTSAEQQLYNTWRPGHRITYILDFTKGAGYNDPDPNPDPDDPTPDPDPDDKPEPILDGLIKFTVSVQEWSKDTPIYPDLVVAATGGTGENTGTGENE